MKINIKKNCFYIGIIAIVIVVICFCIPRKNLCDGVIIPKDYTCYNIGKYIEFFSNGNGENIINTSDGWSGAEANHRWGIGKDSYIKLYIPYISSNTNKGLLLTVNAFGVKDPQSTIQTIEVFANKTKIADWKVYKKNTYTAIIPVTAITDNKLTIGFHALKPYKPIGESRTLSLAISTLKLTKATGYEIDKKVTSWLSRIFNKIYHETPEEKKLRQEQWKEWTEGN